MSLLDISASDDENTCKRKARELACKGDIEFMVWKDKRISKGVKGIQEWDNMVNNYTDGGKRRPKNPDPLGPPFPTWRNVGYFSPCPPQRILWGYVTFTTQTQRACPCLHLWSHWPWWNMLRVSWPSWKCSNSCISSLCSKVVLLLHWGYCIRGVHSLAFQSTGLMKPRTGTSHSCPVAHSVHTLSRRIWLTSTTLSVRITARILRVEPASVP